MADDVTILHIPLKREWDYSRHFDDDKDNSHCHVIRKKEQEMLVDFLQRKNEGALLLSGKRGVGKTSAIFSAIQEAKRLLKKNDGILNILVNAPNFEINKSYHEKTDQIDLLEFKRLVLQTLVRRLYQAAVKRGIINIVDDELVARQQQINRNIFSHLLVRIKSKIRRNQNYDKLLEEKQNIDIKKRIHSLYRRAVAKEVRQVTNLKQLEQEKYRLEREKNFQVKLELVGTTIVSFLLAILTAFYPLTQIEVFNRILSVLVGTIPPAAAISWQVRKTLTNERDIEKEASIYYLHDYDISTLQSELEETLHKLLENNYKVIFIIDELDKIEEKYVIEVIKSLKVLFNQGSSLFILVTGEEFFSYVIKHSEDRSTEYTLFPQKIFLTRPQMEEVQVFMTNIVGTEYKPPDEYRTFINYACYVSKSDFFDLYGVLRDHIIDYDSNRPIIDIGLNRVQILQANFQKAMAQVYSLKQYHQPSDWNKNDLLLDKMYELLDRLTRYRTGYDFIVDTKVPFNIIFKKESSDELDVLYVPDIIEAGALTDLIVYLTWLNALRQTTENHYQITGNIDKVPDKPTIYTREEIDFLAEFKKFQYILVSYVNLFKIYSEGDRFAIYDIETFNQHRNKILEIFKGKIGISLDQPSFNLDQLFSIYEDLSPIPSRHYEREVLHDPIKEINAAIDYVSQQFISVIKAILKKFKVKVRSLSIQELNSELDLRMPTEKMSSMQINNLLLERQHSLEQKYPEHITRLIIIQNPPIEIAKAIENIDPERKRNYYQVILTTNTSVANDFLQPLKDDPHIEFVGGILKQEIPASQKILSALIDVILSWDPVTATDLQLGYSCWRSPNKDQEGKKMYTFHVIIDVPDNIFNLIEYVIYKLPPSWPKPNQIRKIDDRSTCFGMKELAYGPSTIHADVKIKAQDKLVTISHTITLTETGPRLVCPH